MSELRRDIYIFLGLVFGILVFLALISSLSEWLLFAPTPDDDPYINQFANEALEEHPFLNDVTIDQLYGDCRITFQTLSIEESDILAVVKDLRENFMDESYRKNCPRVDWQIRFLAPGGDLRYCFTAKYADNITDPEDPVIKGEIPAYTYWSGKYFAPGNPSRERPDKTYQLP